MNTAMRAVAVRFRNSSIWAGVCAAAILVLCGGCADTQLQLDPVIRVSPAGSVRPADCSVVFAFASAKTERLSDCRAWIWFVPVFWWWTNVYDPQQAYTTCFVLRDALKKGLLDARLFTNVGTWSETEDRGRRGALLLTLSCEGGGYYSTYTHYGIGFLSYGLVMLAGAFAPYDYGARVEVELVAQLSSTETGQVIWGPKRYCLATGAHTRPWWWSSNIGRMLSQEMEPEVEKTVSAIVSDLDSSLPPATSDFYKGMQRRPGDNAAGNLSKDAPAGALADFRLFQH